VDVDTIGPIPTPVQAAGYRIVQESLTNVLRHANAQAASVVVRADEDMLTIVVADDGIGHPTPTQGSGAGVRGMRERAAALGGTLESGPAEGGGWRVEATLPLAPAGARA
jgi:signal transduction histidine kinase